MARSDAVSFDAVTKGRGNRRYDVRRNGIERGHDPLAADYDSARKLLARVARECLRPHWKLVAVVGAVMVAGATTGGLIPLLMQKAADGIFVRKDPSLIFVVPALFLLVTILRAAIDWVSTVFEAQLSAKIVADLRVRMFDTVAAADLAWIQQVHSGRFVSVFLGDSGTVDRSCARVLIGLTRNLLSVAVLTGAMFYLDWRLSIIVLIGAPIAIVNLGRQKARIRQAVRQSMKHSGDLGSMLTQTLQGMRVVKAYSQEHNESRRFRRLIRNLRKYAMQATRSRAKVSPVSDIVAGAGTAAAILYGGWQGIHGDLTLGHFAGFLAAASLALGPLKSLASTQATLSEGLLAAARVFALIDHASHVVEKRDAIPLNVDKGAIKFTDVTFGYDPGKPVLQNFSLEVAPGKKVALVGPSGAGKSTVLNLILRFYDPASGAVSIDGQDLRDATLLSVRGASALLTQEPVLFDDSIGGNITYGSEGADHEEVEAAAKSAAAHDFIMRLPQGYRTRVGETGNRLSGGERQRVAFARAILRDTPILLLDEPTSALDAESEVKVQGAMERLLAGRTVVMIAHRLSTVKRADLICLMESGSIIESGSHAELVALNGRYARMVEAQFLGPDGPGANGT